MMEDKRYQLLSNHTRDIILFVRETDGQILEANNAAVEAYGYTHEELLNLTIKSLSIKDEFTPPDDSESSGEEAVLREKLHLRKDGGTFPVEVSTQVAVIGNEKVALNIIRDITDRKQYEDKLKEQKSFVESLIQNSSVPTFVIDINHKIIIWNRACEDLTQLEKAEVLGTDNHWKAFYETKRPCLADIVIEGSLDQVPDYYDIYKESTLISGGLHSEGLYPNLGGKQRYIVFDAAPIYNDKGKLIAAIETLRDITERKLAEMELEQKNRKMVLELEMAAMVQKELLPKKLPQTSGVGFSFVFRPSIYVAGDGLDVFQLDNHHVGFYILDVMGHGITAALKSITLNYLYRDLIRSFRMQEEGEQSISPARVLKALNDRFLRDFTGWKFFTTFYGVLNTKNLQLTYARAGHCHPLLVTTDSGIRELKEGGPAIGFLKDVTYTDYTLELNEGDKILLYTDGVIEAKNLKNEEYSKKRLEYCISRYKELDILPLVSTIINDVMSYAGRNEIEDDLTLLGIEIKELYGGEVL